MRNEKRCFPFTAQDGVDLIRYAQARLIVERGKRFIEQQKLRRGSERSDLSNLLPHPA